MFILFTNELEFFTNLAVCSEVNLLKQAGFVEAGPVVGIEEQVEVEERHHQVGEHLGGNDDNNHDNHDIEEQHLHRIM